MSRQIPLSFPVADSYAQEDFLTLPCNQEAMNWVDRFPDWPYPCVIIYGEVGCGKTHLLSVWQAKVGGDHIAIDNAESIFGDEEKETELFHLFNKAKENLTYLFIAMSNYNDLNKIILPDLRSRLNAAPKVEIIPPDDMDMQAILVKLFHDRQLKVEPGVIAYILPRVERSYAVLRDLVARLDNNALAEKRAITIPLIRNVLAEPQLFD